MTFITVLAACGGGNGGGSANPGTQAADYIKASNTELNDLFGNNIALSADGKTLAVGAPLEDSISTGVNGGQSNGALDSGAVYIYTLNSAGVWSQQAYVKASNAHFDDRFGISVALSADGNTLAVGAIFEDTASIGINQSQSTLNNFASNAGAAYVFTRSGSTWSQQAYVKSSDTTLADNFGIAVSLSNDGNTLAVGAYKESINLGSGLNNFFAAAGGVRVYVRSGVTWSQQAALFASNFDEGDNFGGSVVLSGDGNTLAVGAIGEDSNASGLNGNAFDNTALGAGAVYVFARSGNTWTQQKYIKASNTAGNNHFGYSLALSFNGNTLAVGAVDEDSDTRGVNGDQTNSGALGSGAVYVFVRTNSSFNGLVWSQQAYIKPSNTLAGESFGQALALSADGNILAVGAEGDASAATGINGNSANTSAPASGAVFSYVRTNTSWAPQRYIKATNTDAGDNFGTAVALSADGNTMAASALREASAATGINGNQADNNATDAGAVYVF